MKRIQPPLRQNGVYTQTHRLHYVMQRVDRVKNTLSLVPYPATKQVI